MTECLKRTNEPEGVVNEILGAVAQEEPERAVEWSWHTRFEIRAFVSGWGRGIVPLRLVSDALILSFHS